VNSFRSITRYNQRHRHSPGSHRRGGPGPSQQHDDTARARRPQDAHHDCPTVAAARHRRDGSADLSAACGGAAQTEQAGPARLRRPPPLPAPPMCSPPTSTPTTPTTSTEMMAVFTHDSVINNHPFRDVARGIDEIRGILLNERASARDDDPYQISDVQVDGNTVSWNHVWSAAPVRSGAPRGTPPSSRTARSSSGPTHPHIRAGEARSTPRHTLDHAASQPQGAQ
jgi:hypothetical protein